MKFHPYAEVFPLIEGSDLTELAFDIEQHGLREKIWTYKGQILDGRNRFLACKIAKVKPEYREYKGHDPLAFVVSLNVQRRHLSDVQRAMAAARIATMRQGERNDLASRDARSQSDAAAELDVSRSSVQRAKKVIEGGSKALQEAVESGEVPLKKAAAVVDLPKSQQLAAAKKKPEKPPEPELPAEAAEDWEPDSNEDEMLALAESELAASIDKVMASDDRLAAAHAEIKRLTTENGALRLARDGYMNGKNVITKMLKAEQRKVAKLTKELAKALEEINRVRAA